MMQATVILSYSHQKLSPKGQNMQTEYYKEYSNELGRDMEFKVYGWAGVPVLAVPCQNGRFFEWEGFHMFDDTLADYLNDGRIRVFTLDTIDSETVSDVNGDPYWRIRRYEQWYNYICNELVPRIHEIMGNGDRILTTGFSMGAYHAANLFFRRPDLFRGCISCSGIYDTYDMYNGYMDDVVYRNDPCASLSMMPKDHPYIDMYNHSDICICVGQGAWEGPLLAGTRRLDPILRSKGIRAWVDYWGFDVNHDWPWWRKQIRYFLDNIL